MVKKFNLGEVVMTRGVNDRIADDIEFSLFVLDCLRRHVHGDWGELPEEDREMNEDGLKNGGRLLSSYSKELEKVWIITEWDRNATRILFPEEY